LTGGRDAHSIQGHDPTNLTSTTRDDRQERMGERWREAFERMDQRADERHREVLQVIQALKG